MKANRLQTMIIIIKTMFVTLYYSLRVLFDSLLGRIKREKVDRYIKAWASKVLRYSDVSCKVVGLDKLDFKPGKAYILMSNHTSLFDIPVIINSFPKTLRMISKKELLRVPIWGPSLEKSEFIFIDRKNKEQAIKDLERAKDKLNDGVFIWMAPEGTRTRTGKMKDKLKKGGFILALQTNAEIIPIGLRGVFNVLPPDTLTMTKGLEVEVHFGQAIDTAEYGIKRCNELAKVVNKALHQLAGEEMPTE